MTRTEIAKVLEDRAAGKHVNLQGADLRGANLQGADLWGADLRGANLQDANLQDANLRGANLQDANLRGANLQDANLRGANLQGAALRGANLQDANLRGANLQDANLRGADLQDADLWGANLQGAALRDARNIPSLAAARLEIQPREGEVVGWKKCCNNVLVKLRIPADAKRSNATGRKCRAERAEVLEVIGAECGVSMYDGVTKYRVGEIVTAAYWHPDRWVECDGGIHYYLTRDEAAAHFQ